jgi:DNA processing protein
LPADAACDDPAPPIPHAWPPGFARSQKDREALAVLLGMGALTPRRLLALAQTATRASRCLRAVQAGKAGGPTGGGRADSVSGRELLARAGAVGARLVTVDDQEYPPQLLDLADPPAGLFVKGQDLCGLEPRVAVVGARNCSPTGDDVARAIGTRLGLAGVAVVSGGALGIDSAAHEGALRAGGRTVAVLGSGIDVTYPRSNRDLFGRIAQGGAILSEYPPGVPAEPFRFPARNRVIAALSRGVVVVEGAEGSGSMITADHALDIGREVYAVPGPVTSDLSFAPHHLIRDGARLITGGDQLLEELGMVPLATSRDDTASGSPQVPLHADEGSVLQALQGPTPVDRLAIATGMPTSRVLSALGALDLRGMVRQVGGRWERRARWS